MRDRHGVAATVREILGTVCPAVQAAGVEVVDDTRLGRDQLGLDSIEIAEVLLACEEQFETRIEALLDGTPLTFGRVVDHFAGA
ncbi:MAG: phosphopantetheine-binding protein [Chloroflexi bacterium]|nr:phosphopantetheine-binding protein [Chloroflexota bacterium]